MVISFWTSGCVPARIAGDAREFTAMTKSRSALLIVDVQKDFSPGGALPVPNGDRVVPVLNGYIAGAAAQGWPVYASRDWHPPVTRHFQPYGGQWPPHCVQHTDGATFHADLRSLGRRSSSAGARSQQPWLLRARGIHP
jgi:hypothetical protein